MVRLRDPAGQAMRNSAVDDSFADPESKSICFYIDLTTSMTDSETTDNDNVSCLILSYFVASYLKMCDLTGRPPSESEVLIRMLTHN